MIRIIQVSWVLWVAISSQSALASDESAGVACPPLMPAELTKLGQDRVLIIGAHKWYLHDLFELPNTLGNHIPLDLSVNDMLETKTITYVGQLDSRTCQYNIVTKKDRNAHVTFKLMGD
jgi:hypothetical protein